MPRLPKSISCANNRISFDERSSLLPKRASSALSSVEVYRLVDSACAGPLFSGVNVTGVIPHDGQCRE